MKNNIYLFNITVLLSFAFVKCGRTQETKILNSQEISKKVTLADYQPLKYWSSRCSISGLIDGSIGYEYCDSIVQYYSLSEVNQVEEYFLPSEFYDPGMELATKGHYCLISNRESRFIFYNNGDLFKLNLNEKPELVASVRKCPTLHKQGLMVDNLISSEVEAHFITDSTLLIPIIWNYFSKKEKYTNTKKQCPIFAILNINDGSIQVMNYWSKPTKERSPYSSSLMQAIHSEVVDKKLLVSTPYSGVVDVFDIQKNEIIRKVNMTSTFQSDSILPLSKKDRNDDFKFDRFEVERAYYGPIVYNPLRKEYYRIFYHALPEKNENGDYTIYQDKTTSIIVFNSSFVRIQEVVFEDMFFARGITPCKEGFILNSTLNFIDGEYCVRKIILN